MYDTQKKAHRVKILLFFLHQGTFFAKPRKHRKKTERPERELRKREKRGRKNGRMNRKYHWMLTKKRVYHDLLYNM